MAREPNVALFKKIMALFKSRGAKKFGKIGKKVRVDDPQQKKVPNFPFFGPPTKKGWRPLLYCVYLLLMSKTLWSLCKVTDVYVGTQQSCAAAS